MKKDKVAATEDNNIPRDAVIPMKTPSHTKAETPTRGTATAQ